MRPEPIGHVLGAREARMRRAVERWCEGNDARGTPLEFLAHAAADAAVLVGRDLLPSEVERVCTGRVRAFVDDAEQAAAEEAIASAREQERLEYLARTAERLRLTRSDPPPRDKP